MRPDDIFEKGDVVYHIYGGRGEVLSIKEDTKTGKWYVIVRVLSSVFDDTRRTPIEYLKLDRRKRD